MKKILSLLAVAAISTPTAGLTSGWTENHNQTLKVTNTNLKFDSTNLSTWGSQQTNIICESILNNTIGFPYTGTWSQWINGTFQNYKEKNALSFAFDSVTPKIHFGLIPGTEQNIITTYKPAPNPNAPLLQTLFNGVHLQAQGINGITGTLSFLLTTDTSKLI